MGGAGVGRPLCLIPNSRFHGESNLSEPALHCLEFPFRLFLQVGTSLLRADELWSWELPPPPRTPALRERNTHFRPQVTLNTFFFETVSCSPGWFSTLRLV